MARTMAGTHSKYAQCLSVIYIIIMILSVSDTFVVEPFFVGHAAAVIFSYLSLMFFLENDWHKCCHIVYDFLTQNSCKCNIERNVGFILVSFIILSLSRSICCAFLLSFFLCAKKQKQNKKRSGLNVELVHWSRALRNERIEICIIQSIL